MSRWALCGAGLAAALGLIVACAEGQSADVGDPGLPDLDGGDGDARLSGNDGGTRLDGSKPEGGGTSGCTGKVVINELQSNGALGAEFVELFNPNSCDVALGGWKLDYRSKDNGGNTPLYSFVAKDSIAAGGFFVIGNAEFKAAKDATYSAGGLGNAGGQVGLVDDQDKLVDAVGYKTGTAGLYTEGSPAPDPAAGSIGRKSDGVDTDDNAADFAAYDDPSPGASNP